MIMNFTNGSDDGKLIPETFLTYTPSGMGADDKNFNIRFTIADFEDGIPYGVHMYFGTAEKNNMEYRMVMFVKRSGSTFTVETDHYQWQSTDNTWTYNTQSFYGTQADGKITWKIGFSQWMTPSTPIGEGWARPMSK
jgi:hypothetical protein